MSIIPGEELFSGVVSSEPYFSSLPFFLFLFFYREWRKTAFKHTIAPFKSNQRATMRCTKKTPQQNKNAGALTACSKRECITENIFALENKRLDVFFCLPAPVDSRWRRRGFQVAFIMTVNIIKEGTRTHVIWFGLRHRHPLVDAEGRVSNSHPFLLPVQEQKPKPTQRKTTRPHDRSYYSQDI